MKRPGSPNRDEDDLESNTKQHKESDTQDLPAATSPKPVQKCSHSHSWHATQLILAVLVGAFISYLALSASIPVSLPQLHMPAARDLRHSVACNASLPAQGGIALSQASTDIPDKLIVAARIDEDTSWLDIYLSDIPHIIYQVDIPDKTKGVQHATLSDKGNEAMAYLQFIIDYYDRLPDSIAFMHAYRGGWHLLDRVPVLQRLRWGQHGFANLRYRNSPGNRLDWDCGKRSKDPLWRQFDCDWEGSYLQPGNVTIRRESNVTIMTKDLVTDSVEMQLVWNQTFAEEMGPLPGLIHAPCCAEFVVRRERILLRPRDFYVKIRDWIIRTEIDKYRTGRVLEYAWHWIMGEPFVIQALPECELLFCDELEEE